MISKKRRHKNLKNISPPTTDRAAGTNILQRRQFTSVVNSNLAVTLGGAPNWTFTVPTAGTYLFRARALAFPLNFSSNTTIQAKLALNNNTLGLGAVILGDSSRYWQRDFSLINANVETFLDGMVTIAGITVFSLDHLITNNQTTNGGGNIGTVSGYEEVYATVEIMKIG